MNKIIKAFIESSPQEQLHILDVGGYRGEFSDLFLESENVKIFIYEPDKTSYEFLAKKYSMYKNVEVSNIAVSNFNGESSFFTQSEGYRSSLLVDVISKEFDEVKIKVDTIDNSLKHIYNDKSKKVCLLKIDTQGNDLLVLEGAKDFINTCKPLIICEVIFQPLYKDQNSFQDIINILYSFGYMPVFIENIHLNENGFISYSDFYFMHSLKVKEFGSDLLNKSFQLFMEESILNSYTMFKEAAEERLKLIDRLTFECNERERTINEMKIQLEYYQKNSNLKTDTNF